MDVLNREVPLYMYMYMYMYISECNSAFMGIAKKSRLKKFVFSSNFVPCCVSIHIIMHMYTCTCIRTVSRHNVYMYSI